MRYLLSALLITGLAAQAGAVGSGRPQTNWGCSEDTIAKLDAGCKKLYGAAAEWRSCTHKPQGYNVDNSGTCYYGATGNSYGPWPKVAAQASGTAANLGGGKPATGKDSARKTGAAKPK